MVEFLNSKDYFIEPNSVILDPNTGKNREIDIVAHKNDMYKDYENKVNSMVFFAFELKNNLYPVVLLSKYHFNPSSPDDLIREYISSAAEERKYDGFENFYEPLIHDSSNIYSQYCSFNKKNKNAEMMAYHPDELYNGISKVVQFCEDHVPWWYEKQNLPAEMEFGNHDEWFRHWLYLPVILLKNELYEFEIQDNQTSLRKTEKSHLIFNYHYKNEPKSIMVTFITEKGLPAWLERLQILESQAEAELLKKKKKLCITLCIAHCGRNFQMEIPA